MTILYDQIIVRLLIYMIRTSVTNLLRLSVNSKTYTSSQFDIRSIFGFFKHYVSICDLTSTLS